jgi:hypothetical protein
MVEEIQFLSLHKQPDKDHAFRAHQKWLRKVSPQLAFCNKTVWAQYHKYNDYLLGRFR